MKYKLLAVFLGKASSIEKSKFNEALFRFNYIAPLSNSVYIWTLNVDYVFYSLGNSACDIIYLVLIKTHTNAIYPCACHLFL